jgi:drug/metabolite transporter (DMT)-like permease
LLSIFGAGQDASAAPISAAISAKRATPNAFGAKSDATLRARAIPVFQRSHMSFLAFFFIVVSLVSFVAAQLILKRAMEATTTTGFRNAHFVWKVTGGVILMTISFFLTLGLLQRFDLSYLYPFQGLSVIFITLMAAVVLKEKLSVRLTIGALLISAGIVLVSLS